MASINVNEIYETVRGIANKANNVFTPAEFNRVAKLANSEIFKKKKARYAINQFASEDLRHLITADEALSLTSGVATTPATKEQIIVIKSGTHVVCERVEMDRWSERIKSTIFPPTTTYPCYRELASTIEFYPTNLTDVKISYLRLPATPLWNYTAVSSRPVYASSGSVHFEWQEQERETIVNMILSYLGITIREPQLTQFAELQEQKG